MKKGEIKITLTEPQQKAFWSAVSYYESKIQMSEFALSKEDIGKLKSIEAIKNKIVEARNAQ